MRHLRRPTRRSAGVSIAATLAVALLTTGSGQPTPASRERPADVAASPHAGVAAPQSKRAWGRWVGAWQTADGEVVYRIDPKARAGSKDYGPATAIDALPSGRQLAPDAARHAAWVLASFGAAPVDGQAAAVQLAVDELLTGGAFGVDGAKTAKRLRKLTPASAQAVRGLARAMLASAPSQVGPYVVSVAPPRTVQGSPTPVKVSIRSAAGQPVANRTVEVSAASARAQGRTGPDGTVSLSLPLGVGVHTVTATVANLPDTRLWVREPARRRQSRVAVAGRRVTVTGQAQAVVAAQPTLDLDPRIRHVPGSGPQVPPYPNLHEFWVQITTTANAPLAARAGRAELRVGNGHWQDACTGGDVLHAFDFAINTDGVVTSTPATLDRNRYAGRPLAWRVLVAGNELNEPAAACVPAG